MTYLGVTAAMFAVYFVIDSLHWRQFEAREDGRPVLCGSLAFAVAAAAMLNGHVLWVQQSRCAMIGVTLAATISSYMTARRQQQRRRPVVDDDYGPGF